MCRSPGAVSVAIIGAGLAGTATSVRLLKYLPPGSSICLYEKALPNFPGGLAYNETRTTPAHYLNLQAGRVSMFREKKLDFINWAATTDRSNWPDELGKFLHQRFEVSTAVPRLLYQRYLREKLDKARTANSKRVNYHVRFEEVVAASYEKENVVIQSRAGDEIFNLPYQYVVLATGNLSVKVPEILQALRKHPHVVTDQYDVEQRQRLLQIPEVDDVLILGSGLRSYDAITDLLYKRPSSSTGFRKIYICSRNGRIHPVYSTNHEHEIIKLERPAFLNSDTLTEEDAVAGIIAEVKRLDEVLSDLPSNIRKERIIKAWEPWVPEFLTKVGPKVVRSLQDKYWSIVTTSRIGMVNEIGTVLNKCLKNGLAEVIAGKVIDIILEGENKFLATIQCADSSERKVTINWIISCTGRETDYAKVDSLLWRDLIDKGLAVCHRATGRGIETGAFGVLVGKDQKRLPRMVAAGVMREGAETEQNGRLGSFVFSIGPVRNNALQAAAIVMLTAQVGDEISEWAENLAGKCLDFPKKIPNYFSDVHLQKEFAEQFEAWLALCRDWLVIEGDYKPAEELPKGRITRDLELSGVASREEIDKCYALCVVIAVQRMVDISSVSTDWVEEDTTDS